jgi:trehalose 6-phosphate phosphatase
MAGVVAETAAWLAEILSHRPSGLITDIDGTISRIALTPDAAIVEPEAKAALASLAEKLDLVAAVTGRSARDAAAMVDLPGLTYVGNHGMEILFGGRRSIAQAAAEFEPLVRELLERAEAALDLAGLIFEDKGVTASIHYRAAPEPALAKPRILEVLVPLAEELGLRLTEGRMVVEIRPPVVVNKGTAVRQLADDFHLRSLVFLGDDVTDLDAMRVVAELRDAGVAQGAVVGVLSAESPAPLVEHSDIRLGSVDDVAELLMRLALQLGSEQPARDPRD